MVVLGYGIWDDFSDKAVQLRVRRHLAAVKQWGGSAPRLVFLGSDARHRSDFVWQNDKHAVAFNGKMVCPLPPPRTTHPPRAPAAAFRPSHTNYCRCSPHLRPSLTHPIPASFSRPPYPSTPAPLTSAGGLLA
jgi:hypothetical protein